VELGRILAESGLVHAMMDLSDGLATDLAHICTESGMAAEIFEEALPVSEQLKKAAAKLQKPVFDWVLKGGEDYQLLFTVPPDRAQELRQLVVSRTGKEIYPVGRIIPGQGVFLCSREERREISYQGYDHFDR
jgi:thiamine-monophosphate kinase